ncbi:MAG: hypothetical protein QM765_28190 [Myxococcales bacterium]
MDQSNAFDPKGRRPFPAGRRGAQGKNAFQTDEAKAHARKLQHVFSRKVGSAQRAAQKRFQKQRDNR